MSSRRGNVVSDSVSVTSMPFLGSFGKEVVSTDGMLTINKTITSGKVALVSGGLAAGGWRLTPVKFP